MRSIETKKKAEELRREGLSLGEVSKRLHVSKSTLSIWLSGISHPNSALFTNRKEWLRHIQPLAAQSRRNQKQKKTEKLISETKATISALNVNIEMKKAILTSLYWSEGSKTRGGMTFVNTDPRLMLLFITLLRECYSLDETRFRISLHLHDYHKEKEVKKFWSKLLSVPEEQFYKIYRKHRSKENTFRRNFGGICSLRYNSEDLKDNITQYAYALGEKITGGIKIPDINK